MLKSTVVFNGEHKISIQQNVTQHISLEVIATCMKFQKIITRTNLLAIALSQVHPFHHCLVQVEMAATRDCVD